MVERKHITFYRRIDNRTIASGIGTLIQTIRAGGLLFETADSDALNYRAELRDAMLRAIGNSRFAIYHHVIRRRADADMVAQCSDQFSERLDARWRERLEKRDVLSSEPSYSKLQAATNSTTAPSCATRCCAVICL